MQNNPYKGTSNQDEEEFFSGRLKENGNPYVGPRTFNQDEGELFFGREKEARQLLARVISERLLLFYAQSGAGKTSLINARLIPRLRDADYTVLPVGRVSGEIPAGVKSVGNVYAYNLMHSLGQGDSSPEQFETMTLYEFLRQLIISLKENNRHQDTTPSYIENDIYEDNPVVLIVDQFEEILTTHTAYWSDREAFFRQLETAMAKIPVLWVVLTLREDYVAALESYAHIFTDKMRAKFHVQRMTYEAALEAIQEPAKLGQRPFAIDAAKNLVDDLCQIRVQGKDESQLGQYIEPVQLQVVCYQLWERLKNTPVAEITVQDLQDVGDVNVALAGFYEQTIQKTLQQCIISEIDLRNWFDEKLITEAKTRSIVYQGESSTGDLDNKAVKLLADKFLLRAENRSGGMWYELTHDRFIDPILQANQAWWQQQWRILQEINVEITELLNMHKLIHSAVVSGEQTETYEWVLQGAWESCHKALKKSKPLQHGSTKTKYQPISKISKEVSEILLQPLNTEKVNALGDCLSRLQGTVRDESSKLFELIQHRKLIMVKDH